MQSNPSLPSLSGSLSPSVVVRHEILTESNKTVWHLICMQTNDLWWIELLEVELFDHLIVP